MTKEIVAYFVDKSHFVLLCKIGFGFHSLWCRRHLRCFYERRKANPSKILRFTNNSELPLIPTTNLGDKKRPSDPSFRGNNRFHIYRRVFSTFSRVSNLKLQHNIAFATRESRRWMILSIIPFGSDVEAGKSSSESDNSWELEAIFCASFSSSRIIFNLSSSFSWSN